MASTANSFSTEIVFTAQFRNVGALNRLFLKMDNSFEIPEMHRLELLPIVVFMAFAVESYINSIGFRRIPQWGDFEKKSWQCKMKILHRQANREIAWEAKPLEFAKKIFKLRNMLAHGKPEKCSGPSFAKLAEAQRYAASDEFLPDWYREITTSWVLNARDEFETLMEYLAEMHGLSPTDYCAACSVDIVSAPSKG